MKKAIILGCSHAAGALMFMEPGLVLDDNQPQRQTEYGGLNSYPMLVAEMMGYEPHNHAISGGSNDAMFRVFAEQEEKYDLVIACWTGMDRGELWHLEHNYWRPITYGFGTSNQIEPNSILKQGVETGELVDKHEQYNKYGKQWIAFENNNQRGFNNKIKNVMALNMLAKHHGTEVINLDSFQGIYDFSWPGDVFRPFDDANDEFGNFCINNDYPSEPSGHFFKPAHQAYAEYIKSRLDYINNY